VFAADVLTLAFSSIRELTTRCGRAGVSAQARTALFAHVWSAVDQLHVIRSLLRTGEVEKMGPNTRAFYERSESASLMRNRMDHVAGNIPNLGAQKGIRVPLFGVLSYFLVEEHQMTRTDVAGSVNAGTIISVTSGSVPQGKALVALPNPPSRPIYPPVCQFLFSAFEWTLDLEDLVKALQELLNDYSERVEADLRQKCQAESDRTGVPLDQLMAPLPIGDFVLELDISFEGGKESS